MSDEKKLPVGRLIFGKAEEGKSISDILSNDTIDGDSLTFVSQSEYEQAQQRIQELESDVEQLSWGLQQIKGYIETGFFPRVLSYDDIIIFIDKVLSEDSDDE